MANDKIVKLSQNAERVKQVLDQVDSVLRVTDSDGNITGNLGKYWVTGQDSDGKEIINPVRLSDDLEYKTLEENINGAKREVGNMKDQVDDNSNDLIELTGRIAVLEANMDMIASKITITRITEATTSVLYSNPGKLLYNVISKDSTDAQTGNITVVWRRGGSNGTLLKTETVEQGDNSFDLVGHLVAGNNTITAIFTDSYGTSRTMNWQINAVDIKLTSEFDDTIVYEQNAAISYVATGSVDKVVHFELDGEEIYSITIGAGNNNTQSYNLIHRPHGTYALTVYMTAVIGTTSVTSEKLYYDIMFVDEDNEETLIRWPYDTNVALDQYQPTIFNYSVYTPNKETSNINLLVDGVIVSSLSVNKTQQTWVYRPQEYGVKTLTIQYIKDNGKVVEKSKTLTINKFPYEINQVTGNLELDFNPTGRTNNDTNFQEFSYTGTSGITTTMTVNEEFDWNNGGWKVDSDGNTYFCVKAGDRMTLDYPLFKDGKDAKSTGKNIKFIYKATNCRDFKAPVMSCMETRGTTHKIEITTIVTDPDGEEISSNIETLYYVNGINPEDETDIREDLVNGTTEEVSVGEDGNTTTITTVITSESSFVGIDVQAQDAMLYCQTGKINAVYCEEKTMALEFNIESSGELKNTMTAYTDADPIKVELYDGGTASFVHSKAIPIVFGSDSCDVYIYRFKVYSSMLSDNDIMSNFIADSLNSTEMVERYERNDILNQNGDLDYQKLSELFPDLRIILITCPRFTNDKNDKVKGCTVQQIMGNGDPLHNWTSKNVQIKGQGTSSNEYGTSARNIDLKFNKYTKEDVFELDEEGNPIQEKNEDDTPKVDEEGKPVYKLREIAFEYSDNTYGTEYAMTDKSIGVNYINVKVNVASSENANNSRLAQRFHEHNPYIRPARQNPKVRDTMEFHPCVIFLKEEGGEGNETQEFPADGTFHFYAYGDFGNSKKNHEALGMDKNNLKECIVEISNNTHPLTWFKKPEGWDELFPVGFDTTTNQLTDYVDYWDGDAVEFRYPEDLYAAAVNKDNKWKESEIADARARLAELQPAVQRLWNWVNSTDTTAPTNEFLSEAVTYAGVEYTIDTVEYRKAKFINEYQEYFIKDSLLFHYLFTDRYLMIDNRAKNVFIHTTDGLHWDFCFNYDNDTSLGCDNRGDLKFDYFYEDIDQIGGVNVYNAQDSILWVNVRNLLWNDLKTAYDNSAKCWLINGKGGLLDEFKTYQAMKPERLEMIDMRRKYLRPYKEGHYRTNLKKDPTGQTIVSQGQYLTMLNGKKALQRERFENYRSIYCNSKYQATAIKEDLVTFRSDSPDYADPSNPNHISVTWGEYFDIVPYCNMYLYMDFDEDITDPIRSTAGVPTRIYKPSGKLDDKNTRIYGASMISDIGDLAPFFINSPDFGKGTKLSTLKIGDGATDYKATSKLKSLSIGSNKMLETLDLQGCQDLKVGLDLSGCSGLKNLYTERSGITGVTFADGGLVEVAKLNAVTSLVAHNLKNLREFTMTNYLSLTSLNVENTSLLTAAEFVERCRNANVLRLIGINWDLSKTQTSTFLDTYLDDDKYDGIDENGGIVDLPVISGEVKFDVIKESQLNKYNEIWPTLNITYTTLTPQFKVEYLDWDKKTVLYSTYIDQTKYPYDPVELGHIPTPIRPSSIEYDYTFAGWEGDMESMIVGPRTFIAKYSTKTRTYKVRWWKDKVGGTYLKEAEYLYGEDAVFVDETNALAPYKNDLLLTYNLFKGWDKSTSYVQEDLDVVALWETATTIGFDVNTETDTLTAAQLCAIVNDNKVKDVFTIRNDTAIGERIKVQMGFRPEFSNINKQVIIDTPTYFDGSTELDTGIQLMKEDKDWTLFIDAKFVGVNENDATLVSCCRPVNPVGPRIKYSTSSNGPSVDWGSSTHKTSWGTNREVYVIRHKAGATAASIFLGTLNKATATKVELDPLNTASLDSTLTFGALKDIDGSYTNHAQGTVFHAVLWDAYLGDSDCNNLVSWTWDELLFDTVSYGRYFTDATQTAYTSIDFFASQALSFKKAPEAKTGNITFFNTGLQDWLEDRFYKGISTTWQSIIGTTYITALKYSSGTVSGENKEVKIWLPAAIEMSTDSVLSEEPYKKEGEHKAAYSTALTRRMAFGAALKEPNPTSEAILETKDWYFANTLDPRNDPNEKREVVNGSVWYNTGNYKVYKDFEWYDWTYTNTNYYLRTISISGSKGLSYVTYDDVQRHTASTQEKGIVPCFSIKKF